MKVNFNSYKKDFSFFKKVTTTTKLSPHLPFFIKSREYGLIAAYSTFHVSVKHMYSICPAFLSYCKNF